MRYKHKQCQLAIKYIKTLSKVCHEDEIPRFVLGTGIIIN